METEFRLNLKKFFFEALLMMASFKKTVEFKQNHQFMNEKEAVTFLRLNLSHFVTAPFIMACLSPSIG